MLLAARRNVGPQRHSHASLAVTVCPFRSHPRWPPRQCELSRPSSRKGKAFGASLRQGRGRTRWAFADFEIGKRVAALCRTVIGKYAGTRGAARFGLRERRRPTLSGLPDAQGVALAGRQ